MSRATRHLRHELELTPMRNNQHFRRVSFLEKKLVLSEAREGELKEALMSRTGMHTHTHTHIYHTHMHTDTHTHARAHTHTHTHTPAHTHTHTHTRAHTHTQTEGNTYGRPRRQEQETKQMPRSTDSGKKEAENQVKALTKKVSELCQCISSAHTQATKQVTDHMAALFQERPCSYRHMHTYTGNSMQTA